MKKIQIPFLDKIETKVIKERPENYSPVSFWSTGIAGVAALLTILLVVVLQMADITQETGAVIAYVCFGSGIAGLAYATYKTIGGMPQLWQKIVLGIYAIVLYILSYILIFKLVVFVLGLAAIGLGVYLAWKGWDFFMRPGSREVVVERNGVKQTMIETTDMLGHSTYEKK